MRIIRDALKGDTATARTLKEEWVREINRFAEVVERLEQVRSFRRQARWLTERFPNGELRDVEGLVKLVEVDRAEIAANDWSLSPGRYVGVAPEAEDEGFDFAAALRNIHAELDDSTPRLLPWRRPSRRTSRGWGYERSIQDDGRDAMTEEIRWHDRFRNFSRAFTLLREALEGEVEALSQLEREGVIQRFEYTFELAWNLLKDRLEYDGIALPTVTPRQVIRQAFQARLIQDGDAWIDMLTDRNLMSHTYDFAKFEVVIRKIQRRYLVILGELYERLSLEALES